MELNKIYHGDSRRMTEIEDDCVHLTVTSPPYYVGKNYEKYLSTLESYFHMLRDVFQEVHRITIPGGKIIINMGDIVVGSAHNGGFPEEMMVMSKLVDSLRNFGSYLYSRIIWEKSDPWTNSAHVSFHNKVQHAEYRILPAWEYVFVFRKGKEARKDKSSIDGRWVDKNTEWKRWVHGVWKIQSVMRNDFHEAMYPEELVRRCVKMYSFPGDVVFDPFMGCYDDKTEVLVRNGWKHFSEVDMDDEFIVRDRNTLKYELPTKLHSYDYVGNMVRIKNKSKDLLVTPNHNMYVKTHADFCAGRDARFIRAHELTQNIYRIPCAGLYKHELDDLSEEFMYLIGMYVSEGYFQKEGQKRSSNLIISQNPGFNQDLIMERLKVFNTRKRAVNKILVPLTKNERDFIFSNCGTNKYNKFLSSYILKQKNLKSLFDSMVLGDGHVSKGGYKTYWTVSEKLRDSFQELCLKLGFETTYSSRMKNGVLSDGREIKATRPCYNIYVRLSKHNKINTTKDLDTENYIGKVYCATVPSHTLFIRRNGKTSWCGNSGTTAAVSKKLGRQYLGYDLEPGYVKLAQNRIDGISDNMTEVQEECRDKTVNKELQEVLF